jgi:3D-(3,5/4)-trihydroxycyclohexane-1,2-dione acylhydrolase (decyclizing)
VIDIKQTPSAIANLHAAVKKAKQSSISTLIHINSDPLLYSPGGEGWWDVPIAPISTLKSTQDAYAQYKDEISLQRPLLGNGTKDKK